jgi:hypothetical protein
VEKERKAGGLGQKAIFFPWLAPWTEVGVGGGSGGGGPPAFRSRLRTARGEKKEGDEGVLLPPHLGLGRAVESAPRGETAVVMGSRWWLDVTVRQGNGGVVVVRWCGEDGAGPFIAGMRRFKGRYLCSPVLRRG